LYPLSKTPELEPYIYLNSKVVSVGRKYMDKRKTRERSSNPFMIKTIQDGSLKNYEVSAIIDASGIWKNPNPLISGGYYFPEEELKDSIFYGIPDVLDKDKDRYEGKHTLVVGSGHSAINTVIQLGKLKNKTSDTSISWAVRKSDFSFVSALSRNQFLAQYKLGEKIEKLMNEQQIDVFSSFFIEDLNEFSGKISVIGTNKERIEK